MSMERQIVDMPSPNFTTSATTPAQTPSTNPDAFPFDSHTPVVRKKIKKICSLGAGYVVSTQNPLLQWSVQGADYHVAREGQHAPS